MNALFKVENNFWRRQTFEYHPVIGWWHVPNLYARIPLGGTAHVFRSNSIGMRSSREYSPFIPKDKKRIVFLGDSYTAGDGVHNQQRFTDLLEARYPHLEAMNFGLNGSGTDQQVLIYESIAKNFDADAYVFCICVENIIRNLCTCRPSFDFKEHLVVYRPKPYFELVEGRLIHRNNPVPLEKRPHNELGDWQCHFPYLAEYPGDAYAIYHFQEGPYWQTMKKILERFMDQVKGKPVFIVPMPMTDHYLERSPASYWPRFKELMDPDQNRFVIDLLTALKSSSMRPHFKFPNDPHYTAPAHALVANVLEYNLNKHCPELLQTESLHLCQ